MFQCLDLKKEDVLLVRGGTCALGYAVIQLAKAMGCRVIATTHKEEKLSLLGEADAVVEDTGRLAESEAFHRAVKEMKAVTKALELVGPKTLRDTLQCMGPGGVVCNTGVLGGVFALRGFDPIKDLPNGVYLTGFHRNWPSQKDVDAIFDFLERNRMKPSFGQCFRFSQGWEAWMAMDGGTRNGKIVVDVSE